MQKNKLQKTQEFQKRNVSPPYGESNNRTLMAETFSKDPENNGGEMLYHQVENHRLQKIPCFLPVFCVYITNINQFAYL